MNIFKIDADQFQWINGMEDDPDDLCLHGHVMVQIGPRILEDTGTVSATALYLLKSLTEDKIMDCHHLQMIPCCGHFLIANEDLSQVEIIGCDTGTDWAVFHQGDKVKIVLDSGEEEIVNFENYRREVFRFADKVEAFYHSCKPKNLPKDEFSRNGYLAFWNEWHRRRHDTF